MRSRSCGTRNSMENKVLILGANGMLGHALAEVFSDQNPVLLDASGLDVTNQQDVKQKLTELKPTLIINASGYTDVDGAETNIDAAMAVNGTAIGYLAQIAQKLGAILVHYSTDYVFDGKNRDGYKEDDQTNPLSVYGKSKLLGEELLQKNCEMFYILRSSWLFGKVGEKNFVKKILAKAETVENLKVVNDHFGKPTYAADLAKRTKEIINNKKPCGIYHVTNETKDGGITWYDLAKRAIEIKKINCEVVPCSSEEFPQPASRPKYAALINAKLEPMRGWEEALTDYLNS